MTSAAGAGPFRRRTVWLLGGAVVASLVALVVLTVFGRDLNPPPSTGPDAYSRSALGYHGLVALLRRMDIPVVVSRARSAERAVDGLLIVAEPSATDDDGRARLAALVAGAPRVLVVLPKWYGTTADPEAAYLDQVALVPDDEVAAVAEVVGLGQVVRAPAALAVDGLTIAHAPQVVAPDPDDVIHGAGGEAVVVWGRPPSGAARVAVVTDPDLLNNAGLDEGRNAERMVALIDELRAGGPVVFDEVSHGYQREPSLWAVLFRYPLVLATVQVLVVALALGLAVRGRFGPEVPTPRPLGAGKLFLIRHIATLLRAGGHDAAMLRRYLGVAVHQVRAALHAPRELGPAELAAWLERIGKGRGVTVTLAELDGEVAAIEADRTQVKRAAAVAARIHRWQQEMVLGTSSRR
ncbi:MAG: DUF4350 domain-containing protein [Kofleriaceae bacterium]